MSIKTIQARLATSVTAAPPSPAVQKLVNKAIPMALEWMRTLVLRNHEDIQMLFENGTIDDELGVDMVTQGNRDDIAKRRWQPDHDAASKIINKMNLVQWEAMFKAKYKKSDTEMLEGSEKKVSKGKLSTPEIKLLKFIGTQMSWAMTIWDLSMKNEDHLCWYMKSPGKMVVNNPRTQGIVLTDAMVEDQNGMSLADVQALFERFGIKQSKRPQSRRPTPPIYD